MKNINYLIKYLSSTYKRLKRTREKEEKFFEKYYEFISSKEEEDTTSTFSLRDTIGNNDLNRYYDFPNLLGKEGLISEEKIYFINDEAGYFHFKTNKRISKKLTYILFPLKLSFLNNLIFDPKEKSYYSSSQTFGYQSYWSVDRRKSSINRTVSLTMYDATIYSIIDHLKRENQKDYHKIFYSYLPLLKLWLQDLSLTDNYLETDHELTISFALSYLNTPGKSFSARKVISEMKRLKICKWCFKTFAIYIPNNGVCTSCFNEYKRDFINKLQKRYHKIFTTLIKLLDKTIILSQEKTGKINELKSLMNYTSDIHTLNREEFSKKWIQPSFELANKEIDDIAKLLIRRIKKCKKTIKSDLSIIASTKDNLQIINSGKKNLEKAFKGVRKIKKEPADFISFIKQKVKEKELSPYEASMIIGGEIYKI